MNAPQQIRPGTLKLIHAPWDNGVIMASVHEIFPNAVPPKTIKTRCGKRVPFAAAPASQTPTCAECAAELEREKQAFETIKQYAADLAKGGLNYANQRQAPR